VVVRIGVLISVFDYITDYIRSKIDINRMIYTNGCLRDHAKETIRIRFCLMLRIINEGNELDSGKTQNKQ